MQYGMSTAKPNFLQELEKRNLELKSKIDRTGQVEEKPTFNFSQTSQAPKTLNFGAPMSGPGITNIEDYKATIPKQPTQPTQKSGFSVIPKANAMEEKQPQQEIQGSAVKGRGPTNLFINERQALEQMINSGIDETEALEAIKEKRIEKWGTTQLSPQESNALIMMAQADIDINEAIKAVKEKRYDDATILQKIGKNILDLGASGPALVAEQIANVGSFIFNSDELRQQAENIRKIRKEDFEGTIGGKAGSFITGAGEALAVGPTKMAPTLLGRTAQGAMVGGIIGGASPVLEQGKEATMGDIATGGAIGGALGAVATPLLEKVAIPAIAGTASKAMKYGTAGLKGGVTGLGKSVGRDIKSGIIKPFQTKTQEKAGGIALGGIINPAKLDAVKKGLQVDEGIATPQDVGKWMLDRVKPGNKQQIADQLLEHSTKSKKAVDEALAKIPDTFENQSAKKALTQILTDLEGRVGFEDDAIRIGKLLQKDKYTLTELNAVKREMDNIYNIYKQSGEVSASLNAQGLNKVRQDIRRFIENEAKKYGADIRKLNNETSVARGLAEGIMKKDNADNVREFLSAFAPTGVGSMIGAGQSIAQGNDPLIVLRDMLIGGATAKVLTSTKVRTSIASALNKLGPKEMNALEKYIKSGGADEVGRKVAEKIIKPITDKSRLLPAGGQTTKGNIITPQTVEKGIIQESKLPLKNTKYGTNNINSSNSNNTDILLKKSPLSPKEEVKPKLPPKPFNKSETTKTLGNLTKDNIDDIASKITTDTTKLAQVKQVIQKYLKEYGENIKNYLGLLADDIADIVGGRAKLLGGENAKLFDKSRWQEAKDMTKAGKSADEVWEKTGWERGTDGKWKFEIDDSKAKLKDENLNIIADNKSIKDNMFLDDFKGSEKEYIESKAKYFNKGNKTVGDIIEHNDLFKNYPEIKNIKVEYDSNLNGAKFVGGDMNGKDISKIVLGNDTNLKSNLLHEIQHYIQKQEGFAKGGSVATSYLIRGDEQARVKSFMKFLDKKKSDIENTELFKKYNNETSNIQKLYNEGKLSFDSYLDKLEEVAKKSEYDSTIKNLKGLKQIELNVKKGKIDLKDEFIDDTELYRRLTGETEARNIQTRLNKTLPEKKKTRPELTEDVPRSKQIVKMDGGVAMSTNSKQVSKISDDLVSEAKKYKTFEEFKKSQGELVYHGSSSLGKSGVPGGVIKEWKVGIPSMRSDKSSGIYFGNKVVGERYARDGKGQLYEVRLGIKNPKEFPNTVEGYMKFGTLDEADVKQMIKEGYDGAYIKASWKDSKGGSNEEWFAIYPKRIKTEAQLKQIYEQAKQLPKK